jgi:short-subunit dehydrogenase involved in D-alanine esterification of teichoic acids
MAPSYGRYNVAKAGVKVLTEALQHKLRSTDGCRVSAFLLVPGCVNTMIRTRGDRWVEGNDFTPARAKDEREVPGYGLDLT